MKYFRFIGHIYGDSVAGLVKAENKSDAIAAMRRTYSDFDDWELIEFNVEEFDRNGVCEVYYG